MNYKDYILQIILCIDYQLNVKYVLELCIKLCKHLSLATEIIWMQSHQPFGCMDRDHIYHTSKNNWHLDF
jgi:hypothetical protein